MFHYHNLIFKLQIEVSFEVFFSLVAGLAVNHKICCSFLFFLFELSLNYNVMFCAEFLNGISVGWKNAFWILLVKCENFLFSVLLPFILIFSNNSPSCDQRFLFNVVPNPIPPSINASFYNTAADMQPHLCLIYHFV